MGENTRIAWTDHTWNCWQGCHKVSEGCAQCYMYRDKTRYGQDPATVVRSAKATFRAPLRWDQAVLNRARGGQTPVPARVFVCSWSDWFVEEADPWRAEAWEIIRLTPHLIFQILTKRPARIKGCLPSDWGLGWPNVWLGVTAENQACFDERWEVLADIPAAIRFISYEPALGPLDLSDWAALPDWVIAGAESGPNRRPADVAWFRSLRNWCQSARVPFFLKQMDVDGKLVSTPELDGQRWVEFPEVPNG